MVVVFANILSGIGLALLFMSTTLKEKRPILAMQSMNHVCSFVAGLLLKGYSGVIQDTVGFLRNGVILLGIQNKIINTILIVSGAFFGIILNNQGFIGLLPVLATVGYALVVVHPKTDAIKLKLAVGICSVFWAIYGLRLMNYISTIVNLLTAASAFIFVIKGKKDSQ